MAKSNNDVAPQRDLEKNTEVELRARSKSPIFLLTIAQLITIALLIRNRAVIDDVHQMLNSVLLGSLTAGFAQSVIQLFRYVHYPRIIKFFIWGGLNGILSSLWIDALVYNVPAIPMRVLVDQGFGSPFFQGIFILYNCVWENNNIVAQFQAMFFRMLLSSYMIWPLCSIISFNLLPQYYIFPFNCFINVIWTIVLGIII